MICRECDAKFEDKDEKCPYCGALNYLGAEEKYFEELDEIKEDVGEIPNIIKKEYSLTLKKQMKIILVIVCITMIVIGIVIGIYVGYEAWSDKKYDIRVKERILFEKEVFPQLNEWFEAGDYEAIYQYEIELDLGKTGFSLYYWEHYDFLTIYRHWKDVEWYQDKLSNERNLDDSDIASLIYIGIQEFYLFHEEEFTQDELIAIEPYREEIQAIVLECLDCTEEELYKIYQQVDVEYEIPKYADCLKIAKKWKE